MIIRGRKNLTELNDLQDFKIDIDYPKTFSRSKSLANKKINFRRDFQKIEEEQRENDKEIDSDHSSFAHQNKTCNDFYKFHHRNTLPVEKLSPNEDLVTSEYFKNMPQKTKKSSYSSNIHDELKQNKIDNIDREYNSTETKRSNLESVLHQKMIESNMEFSEKTNNRNICRDKFEYEQIKVIKEDFNENEKIEEN